MTPACCPVCRATFRGQRICPRCGSDLTLLMKALLASWQRRQEARKAFETGDFSGGLQMLSRSLPG